MNCYDKDHLGRYSPLQISEHGGLAKAHAAGGAQSGTAILAVTVTDHRLPACDWGLARNLARERRTFPVLSCVEENAGKARRGFLALRE